MKDIESYLKLSASPDNACQQYEQFIESYQKSLKKEFDPKRKNADRLLKIFGNSQFLSRFLIQHPETTDKALTSSYLKKEKNRAIFEKDLQKIIQKKSTEWLKKIRHYKYEEFLRITLKILSGEDTGMVLRELSNLALGILSYVDKQSYEETTRKWGKLKPSRGKRPVHHILALGKLGGGELNYSSDVDLIAITQTDSFHEFFVRHAQKFATNLTQNEGDAFLYRVDWNLRPEGKSGTLVNSLSALENYYESFGQDWERQALIKASPGAGDKNLGLKFIQLISPFVYRKTIDVESLKKIRKIRHRITDELTHPTDKGFNVKLGLGGIRDIEFFIQAFQLIYGGRYPPLRQPNTMNALEKLRKSRLISSHTAKNLHQHYFYLRKLENSLQLAEEAQTHIVLWDRSEQLKTARRMGYLHQSSEEALYHFQKDFKKITRDVQNITSDLFSREEGFVDFGAKLKDRLEKTNDFEVQIDEFRIFKQERIKEIEKLEIQPWSRRRNILSQLSNVAEELCHNALDLAVSKLKPIYGEPLASHLLVLGMGKLGGGEINYASDLDLLFIFSEMGETTGPRQVDNMEYFSRLVQKFIFILSTYTRFGRAYEIDARLRPSGHAGPLVTFLGSFLEYQKKSAQVWEKQALLRARPIWGIEPLRRLLTNHLSTLLFLTPFNQKIPQEMHHLRMRVEKEIAKEDFEHFDFKGGIGGIMDIEFIVQLKQLQFGHQYEKLRATNTFEVLDQLIALNFLDKSSDGVFLKEAYTFYRTLESAISLKKKRSEQRLSFSDPQLADVAKHIKLKGVEDFCKLYREFQWSASIAKKFSVRSQKKLRRGDLL